MNYTVIGNDGKKYGPADAAKLREWLRQARVDSRTPVFAAGAADWTFLGLLPEFAKDFSGPPPVIGARKLETPAAKNNPLATWGFICGLLAWTFCGCCVPFAILGLTFSIIALVQINSAAPPDGRALAIAGIVLAATNLAWTIGFMLVGMLNGQSQVQWHVGN